MVLLGKGWPALRVAGVAAGIINRNGLTVLRGEPGEVSGALGDGGNGSVFVERRGGALAGEREEEKVARVVLDEVRDVGRAEERCAEAVGSVGRLVDLRSADGERFSVERGVAAVPEDGSVGLVGVEVAEVAASAEAALRHLRRQSPRLRRTAAHRRHLLRP